MSNLFSGINARFRGATSKSSSGNKSPTSSTSSQPLTPTSAIPSSSSASGLQYSAAAPTSAADQQHHHHHLQGAAPAALAGDNHNLNNYAGSGSSHTLHQSRSSSNLATKLPPLPTTPSLAQTIGSIGSMDSNNNNNNNPAAARGGPGASSGASADEILASYHLPRPLPLWLNPAYAKHIVKGNFMTLSARPKTVEQGEWIAHQIVEHYRNLWNFVRVLHEKEDDGLSICNSATCPRMSAGANHSFTWLNARREPVELPAYEYMTLMQRWISGKIDDTKVFPTEASGVSYALNASFGAPPLTSASGGGATAGGGDAQSRDWLGKRSGFPEGFLDVCKTIFRQMFRVYSHLYWAHFTEPFYHLNLEKQLNSCFSHFVLTATALDMLQPYELEPMQPLIDLWAANGTFPQGSKAYEFANLQVGERLLQIGGVAS